MQDLEDSYQADQALPVVNLKLDKAQTSVGLQALSDEVSLLREKMEQYCLQCVDTINPELDDEADHWHAPAFRSYKIANLLSRININDLLQITFSPSLIRSFNPFLSEEAVGQIHEASLLWAQLCVYEDKLSRLLTYCHNEGDTTDAHLIHELQVTRAWNANQHPRWLAFEVEGRLQIRPIQFEVADRLIRSQEQGEQGRDIPGGAINQLNMGEGKTRVILPMLILHFADGKHLVRLHFLSQLRGEAYEYLHQYLCASVLNCKLFLMPFNRDVELVPNMIRIMRQHLRFAKNSLGCLCVAPEHRLSLHLKLYEEQQRKDDDGTVNAELLSNLFKDLSLIDILDESDEVLRHVFQLVYAFGDKLDLPGGPARWSAI